MGRPTPVASSCSLLPGAAERGGSVVIALPDDVDPGRAPLPRNASEEILFQHFYETLIRVDCEGRIVPGLAHSWQRQDTGRAWLFTLREGARFWDGSPVTADDVASSWKSLAAHPSVPAPLPWEGPESVKVLDEQRLLVMLTEPRSRLPLELATPAFRVTAERDFSGWPLGSGPHRPSGPAAGPDGDGMRRVITAYPVSSRSWTVLRFLLATPAHAPDLLAEPVDLLLTDALRPEDASAWPDFAVQVLPWQSTYVLASPSEQSLDALRPALSASRRDALARDVLHGVARGAGAPTWWNADEPCNLSFSMESRPPVEARVVFVAGDVNARALAERVVALAAEPLRAEALAPGAFDSVWRQGSARMYVTALPSEPASPCGAVENLARRAPWMFRGWGSRSVEVRSLTLERHLLPLVETRPILMARKGLVGIDAGAGGALWLDRIGWSRAGGAP